MSGTYTTDHLSELARAALFGHAARLAKALEGAAGHPDLSAIMRCGETGEATVHFTRLATFLEERARSRMEADQGCLALLREAAAPVRSVVGNDATWLFMTSLNEVTPGAELIEKELDAYRLAGLVDVEAPLRPFRGSMRTCTPLGLCAVVGNALMFRLLLERVSDVDKACAAYGGDLTLVAAQSPPAYREAMVSAATEYLIKRRIEAERQGQSIATPAAARRRVDI